MIFVTKSYKKRQKDIYFPIDNLSYTKQELNFEMIISFQDFFLLKSS